MGCGGVFWRGVFCLVCNFHNQKMHFYLIYFLQIFHQKDSVEAAMFMLSDSPYKPIDYDKVNGSLSGTKFLN